MGRRIGILLFVTLLLVSLRPGTTSAQEDGSIVAWGNNTYGELVVPLPNAGFVAVSGGDGFSMGLRTDGSIQVWGRNWHGEHQVPAPNSGFVAISAGGSHCLGLKIDGSVAGWGSNVDGQCDPPVTMAGTTRVGISQRASTYSG